MKRYNYFSVLLIGIIIYTVISCRTHKSIKGPIKEEGTEFILTKMKEHELKYNNLSLRFNADFIYDKHSSSFRGNINILKDSLIWISITPLFGIEAYRIMFSTDTVKIIDKIKKTYYVSDYNTISVLFNVVFDFDMIQSLITGNDFSYYENDVFKIGIDGGLYKLSTVGRRKLKKYVKTRIDMDRVLIQDIWLLPETFKIVKQQLKEIKDQNTKMLFTYENFAKTDDGQYFHNRFKCDISSDNNISLDIQFTRVQVDKPFEFNFIIPDNYRYIQYY